MTDSCPPHHWYLSNPLQGDNGERITHEQCLKCGAERDLIEVKVKKKGEYVNGRYYEPHYTEIRYPERREEMSKFTPDNQALLREKHREYESRKQEIIAKYEVLKGEYGSLRKLSKDLDIPETSLRQLLNRWEVYESPRKGIEPMESEVKTDGNIDQNIDQQDIPVVYTKSNGVQSPQWSYERFRYVEDHAEEIKADILKGMLLRDVMLKWNIGKNALVSFRHRHGLMVIEKNYQRGIQITPNDTELIALFDKVLEQDNILAARLFWQGVKAAKGIG